MDRVPDHAVVSETVRVVGDTLGPSKVRYVSGVLHAALRSRLPGHSGDPARDLVGRDLHLAEPLFRDPVVHPHLWAEDALSIPSTLMKRWTKRFGREASEGLGRYFLTEPPLVLRVAHGERGAILTELEALDVAARAGNRAGSIVCSSEFTSAVMSSDAFQAGRITVQGETASADELSTRLSRPLPAVLVELVELELRDLVVRGPGGLYRLPGR